MASNPALAYLAVDHGLRTVLTMADQFDLDILAATIAMAVHAANLSPHRIPSASPGSSETPAPRPISAFSIAQSLKVPIETTRRHVNKMIERGVLVRVRGGVIFQAQSAGATADQFASPHAGNVRRLVHEARLAERRTQP